MPSTVGNRSVLRMSTRLLVFGLWIMMFSLLILVIFVQLFSSLSSSSEVATLGTQTGMGIDSMAVESIMLLYQGGFLTLGIGGLMAFFGGTLIIRVARRWMHPLDERGERRSDARCGIIIKITV